MRKWKDGWERWKRRKEKHDEQRVQEHSLPEHKGQIEQFFTTFVDSFLG